jgi:hypothetical protein
LYIVGEPRPKVGKGGWLSLKFFKCIFMKGGGVGRRGIPLTENLFLYFFLKIGSEFFA